MRCIPRSLLPALLVISAACHRDTRAVDPNAAGDSAAENPAEIYGVSAAQNVVIQPVEIEVPDLPPGWSGMTIAALSDFQLGLWPDNEKVALAATQAAARTRAD